MNLLNLGFLNKYPYTDFHELNLDAFISVLKAIIDEMNTFVSLNAIKYADPIQWSIIRQYEKNTVVIDPLTGTAYISVEPVPMGVALTNTQYWTVVFDLGSFVTRAAKNFTSHYEADITLTATFNSAANDWIIWGDTLYHVNVNITAGDTYVIGSNITPFTLEDYIGHLEDLLTTNKTSIVDALNEIVTNIKDISIKINGIITPDMFTGANDSEKIQAAIDYAIANHYPTVILDRDYDITGYTLKINKGLYLSDAEFYRYRSILTFVGSGKGEIFKGDAGFMFSADFISGYITFDNVKFRGGANAPASMSIPDQILLRKNACSVFDASKLLYLTSINCNYQQLNNVFDGSNCVDATSNMQNVTTYGDKVTYCNAYVTYGTVWACKFHDAIIENCNMGYGPVPDDAARTIALTDILISGNCIESTYENPAISLNFAGFLYSAIKEINVINSYFEDNAGCDIDISYSNSQGLNIQRNTFNSKTVPSIKKAGSYMDDHINYNYFQSATYGIDCNYLIDESDYKHNRFEQYGGTGSITNSTAAMLSDMIIYQGTIEIANVATGLTTQILPIVDYGSIRHVKTVLVQSMIGATDPSFSYEVRAVYPTEIQILLTNSNVVQDFTVKYIVFGY